MIEIVGIEEGSRGQSCEEHNFCGGVMKEAVVVCLRKVQVLVDGKEETFCMIGCPPTTMVAESASIVVGRQPNHTIRLIIV